MPVNYDAVIPLRGSRDVKPQRRSLSSSWSYLNRAVELQACHTKVTLLNVCESTAFPCICSSLAFPCTFIQHLNPLSHFSSYLLFFLQVEPHSHPTVECKLVFQRTTRLWKVGWFSGSFFTVGANVVVNSSNIFTAAQKMMPTTFWVKAIF